MRKFFKDANQTDGNALKIYSHETPGGGGGDSHIHVLYGEV